VRTMRDALYIVAILTGLALYVSPAIVAHLRKHYYRWPITIINIVLGLTVIGWLFCLIWAVWPEDPSRPQPIKPSRLSRY